MWRALLLSPVTSAKGDNLPPPALGKAAEMFCCCKANRQIEAGHEHAALQPIMRIPTIAVSSMLVIPLLLAAQTAVPDQTPSNGTPTAAPPQPSAPAPIPQSPPFDRPVSWKLLLPNLVNDQERIWLFPARLVQGQNWIPTAAILGTTAGLIALDPTEASYFRGNASFHTFNNIFTGNATAIGTIVAPASLYIAGLLRKDSKMERTALLAGEAVADSEIVATVFKDAAKRARPASFPAQGNLYDSWFESSGSPLRGNGSFPSGHTIAAFSVATVVARRYGNHRWIPYVAYGAAALVGFSRLSLSAHFLSDVFVGGALGYSISRFTVLRQ
jgi:membrane-associated phospholipid phosphatase